MHISKFAADSGTVTLKPPVNYICVNKDIIYILQEIMKIVGEPDYWLNFVVISTTDLSVNT